ncbi:uncharacterized protein [Henckelia pumila]|uniref:uncharacterized protein isoform X2 n=1 Tax=Henckelia pumila TaxID=405737 RepID=UPI003C6DF2E3
MMGSHTIITASSGLTSRRFLSLFVMVFGLMLLIVYSTSPLLLREHPSTTIMIDARTSMALTRFIMDRGGLHRVGYKNVIDKGMQLYKDGIEAHLMMETSGHGALKENHFLDDGAYMIVNIIIEMVR